MVNPSGNGVYSNYSFCFVVNMNYFQSRSLIKFSITLEIVKSAQKISNKLKFIVIQKILPMFYPIRKKKGVLKFSY